MQQTEHRLCLLRSALRTIVNQTRSLPTEVRIQSFLVNPTFVITEIARVTFVMWKSITAITTSMMQAATRPRCHHHLQAPQWVHHYPHHHHPQRR